MKNNKLKIDVRRKKIIEILELKGKIRVDELSEQLKATVVTIRSDLGVLEKDGLLERVPGGAVQTALNFYNRDFLRKKQKNAVSKKSLVDVACKLIQDGDTLFINSGTTTYFLANALKKFKGLKVVTNSLTVAVELGSYPTFNVVLLGGQINSADSFTYGKDVIDQISKFYAKYSILSVDGINSKGVTTLNADEALVDDIMMENSEKKIIIADKSKIGAMGFLNLCGLEKVDIIVTEKTADPEMLALFREKNITVLTD